MSHFPEEFILLTVTFKDIHDLIPNNISFKKTLCTIGHSSTCPESFFLSIISLTSPPLTVILSLFAYWNPIYALNFNFDAMPTMKFSLIL